MKKTILAFGELLWDVLPTDRMLGGAPFNFAYRINSLGEKGFIISRLGRDALGQQAFNNAISIGLNPAYIQWDNYHPTGTVKVTFSAHNDPEYVIVPDVAFDYIELNDPLLTIAATADCICYGTLVQRLHTSGNTLKKILENSPRSLKFVDINLRKDCFTKAIINFSLTRADILKLNIQEIEIIGRMFHLSTKKISDSCQAILKRWSLQYCLVTLAEKGVFACSKNGEQLYIPGFCVDVVDTIGSGDAFSAGFVVKYLQGKSLRDACEFGNILGALAAMKRGATSAISQMEINHFVKQKKERNYHDQFNNL